MAAEAHPLLPRAAGLLAVLASDVSVEGAEVRFSHAGASGRFGFVGPRLEGVGWGFLERRVHFDPLDPPGGLHNLRYAANTINAEGLGGVHAVLLPNAIALRRTVLFRADVTGVESLGPELAHLFGEDVPLLEGVDRLLMRQPWAQALETRRLAAAAARTDQLAEVERMLDALGERHELCPEGIRAGEVVITRSADLGAEASAGSWSGGPDEDLAIAGQPSPAVERLLQSLNARNRTVPYTLCWRPGGVWIYTAICGRRPTPPDLAQLLALTRHGVATEGSGAPR